MLRGVVVRPVLALEGAARRVAAGDLEAKVKSAGPASSATSPTPSTG